tara:strand:- start:3080 stop:6349 length:3270 start_codon:yes stop_codon:yes gene_type:complete
MNTRHAVTKIIGYDKVPKDRANYKVENDISENGHLIEHLDQEIHNSFVLMKDNAIKLGDAYYNIWSKYTGLNSLRSRSGHLIDEIYPPNRKVYDIENNVFNFEKSIKSIIKIDLMKNQKEMIKNGVVLANNYHSNLLMIDKVSIQEVNIRERLIKDLQEKIEDLSKNLINKQNQISSKNTQLNNLNDEYIKIVQSNKIKDGTISDKNIVINEKNDNINDLTNQVKNLNQNVETEEVKNLKLKNELKLTKEKAYNDLKTKLEEIINLQTDILYYKNKTKILENVDKEWRDRHEKAEDDIARLTKDIEKLIASNKDGNNDILTLETRIENITNDVTTKIKKIGQLEISGIISNNNLSNAQSKIIKLELDLSNKITENDNNLQQISSQILTITDLSKNLTNQKKELVDKNEFLENLKMNYKYLAERSETFLVKDFIPKAGTGLIKLEEKRNFPNLIFYGCLFEKTNDQPDLWPSDFVYQNLSKNYCIFVSIQIQIGGANMIYKLFKMLYSGNNLKGDWYDAKRYVRSVDYKTAYNDLRKDRSLLETYWDNGTWEKIATDETDSGIAISHVYGIYSIDYSNLTGAVVDPGIIQENEELKLTINSLNDNNSKKDIIINDLSLNNAELIITKKSLNNIIAQKNNVISAKDTIISTTEQQMNIQAANSGINLEMALDQMKIKDSKITDLSAAIQEKTIAYNGRIKDLSDILLSKESRITDMSNILIRLQTEYTDLSKNCMDLSTSLFNAMQMIKNYPVMIDELNAKIKQLEGSNTDKKWKDIYYQRYIEYREKSKTLEKEIITLNSKITQLTYDISNNNGSNSQLLKDKLALQNKIGQLNNQKASLETLLKESRDNAGFYMTETWKEQQKVKAKDNEISVLKQKITLLETQKETQQSLNNENNKNCEDLEKQIQELSGNVATNLSLYNSKNNQYNNLFIQSNHFHIDVWIPDSTAVLMHTFNGNPQFTSCTFRATNWLDKSLASCGVYQNPPGYSKFAIFWTAYKRGSQADTNKKTVIVMVKVRYSTRAIRATQCKYAYSPLHLYQFIARTKQPQYTDEIETIFNDLAEEGIVVGSEQDALTTNGYGISDIMGFYY